MNATIIIVVAIVGGIVGIVGLAHTITATLATQLGNRIDDVRDNVQALKTDFDRRFDRLDDSVQKLGGRVTRIDGGQEL